MRTLLLCHREEPPNPTGLAPWLQSFLTLVGVVVLEEARARKWRRVRREIKRVGPRRADILHPPLRNAGDASGRLPRVPERPWVLLGAREWGSERVGMTLLLGVERGVDTEPVYGHFSYPFDPVPESPFVIQERVVFDNLPLRETALSEIVEGKAVPIDVRGRVSAEWGQPWLTKYLAWRRTLRWRGA